MTMYDPEQIDALIGERDRLRAELDHAQTLLAEWEALVGAPMLAAVCSAVARVDSNRPYALTEAYDVLAGAFHKIAEDRNMWRARARRAADKPGGPVR